MKYSVAELQMIAEMLKTEIRIIEASMSMERIHSVQYAMLKIRLENMEALQEKTKAQLEQAKRQEPAREPERKIK